MRFYPLKVVALRREIAGRATSVSFEVPPELERTFASKAGQHIVIQVEIDGTPVERAYTLSSPGLPLRITSKRTRGGLVSNWIGDVVEVGMEVLVAPPAGEFVLDPAPHLRRTHYFFGAGSGITPLFSMIVALLHREPHSVARLLYANRDTSEIIFREELNNLELRFPERLSVVHVLSSNEALAWRRGRIDDAMVSDFIERFPPYAQDAHYYVCGPGTMNPDVRRALGVIDVPAARIHAESFGASTLTSEYESVAATLRVSLAGKSYDVVSAPGETLLSALRRANIDAPFSCQAGVCGSCVAQLVDGNAIMRSRAALSDAEVREGKVLCCQALAQSDAISVVF